MAIARRCYFHFTLYQARNNTAYGIMYTTLNILIPTLPLDIQEQRRNQRLL